LQLTAKVSEVPKSNRTVARERGEKVFIVPFSLTQFNKTKKRDANFTDLLSKAKVWRTKESSVSASNSIYKKPILNYTEHQ